MQWIAREGSNKISEGDFLRRIGQTEQALQADEYLRTGTTLAWVGVGLIECGAGVMAAGTSTKNVGLGLGGAVITLVALPPLLIGARRLVRHRFPYEWVTGQPSPTTQTSDKASSRAKSASREHWAFWSGIARCLSPS